MHISKLSIVNYRNFYRANLFFNKGVNTIIGENGSGKTNLFRAMRLLLDDNMVRAAFRLDEADFHRGLGDWRGHWIIISMEFQDIGPDEAIQALFQHGTEILDGNPITKATYNLIFRPKKEIRLQLSELSDFDLISLDEIRSQITISDYETVFTGRSTVDFTNKEQYERIVGDFDSCIFSSDIEFPEIGSRLPGILSVAKEISFTYIQALRDVVAEFHNNRTNPLFGLLKSKSGEIDPATMEPIVSKVQDLNTSIEELKDVQEVRENIRDTIKEAVGETYSPRSLSIKSDLPDEAEKLFQSLKLFVGESEEGYEGGIHELSLGGANLIFLTLKLLAFKYQTTEQSLANILLIEEPEAHIHTHIQKTLFDRIGYSDTQIIYSTHSTHISEVSNIQNINILGKNGSACEAYQPSTGLEPQQCRNVQRYLDAIRSNLLFAKSVLLVEGDAEEILIPTLIKTILGLSLDELGISLINIRSTGFKNVAILFDNLRIRKRCGIITDLDSAFFDLTPSQQDDEWLTNLKIKCKNSASVGALRKIDLDAFVLGNRWLSVNYATHTFEVDFVLAGNSSKLIEIIPFVYKQASTIATAISDLNSQHSAQRAHRALTMANHEGKGWFAILLAKAIDHKTILPLYIVDAISFVQPKLSRELLHYIYSYRINCALKVNDITPQTAQSARGFLRQFKAGNLDITSLRAAMTSHLPGDQIHNLLVKFV
jgi:putative ATP-dependent endonuclease of OLD family